MEKFAKIIDLPKTQCLAKFSYDAEEDAYKVTATVIYEGIEASLGFGFHSEEGAQAFFDAFDLKEAQKVYNDIGRLVAE